MNRTLSLRELNRATLARQVLLERSPLDPLAVVEHLLGLQAQTPQSWYVGLWTRLATFDPAVVGAALEERRLVRLPVMRSTIHLLTAADALALRPLVDVVIERMTMSAFGRNLHDVDRSALVKAARELVDRHPLVASELGRALAEQFPGVDPASLAQAARAWLPMVQVPPRGLWSRPGMPRQAALETWLGRPVAPAVIEEVVLRHLGAFGPASVRDVQTWCGLTRLAEVVDALRPQLAVFRDEGGRELFDLPDAPRPDPDTPAPVRFLYDFDNLLLSHADRARMLSPEAVAVYSNFAARNKQPAAVLVDGVVAATWAVTRAGGTATLTVTGIRALTGTEWADIQEEGARLLAFLHPRDPHRIEPA